MQIHSILRPYHWENRILLIFSVSEEDSIYLQQDDILESSKVAIEERDLVIFHVFSEYGIAPRSNKLNQQEVKSLRDHFVIKEDYQMLLIGKDGTIKKKYDEAVAMSEINRIIDAMPMRQSEMRRDQ